MKVILMQLFGRESSIKQLYHILDITEMANPLPVILKFAIAKCTVALKAQIDA
jgi:hypothetical protein